MPDDIYLDNDLITERVTVTLSGQKWPFVWSRGTVDWWLRYQDWLSSETATIQEQGWKANLKTLYDLAGDVFGPDLKREQLERVPPAVMADVCGLFARAWFRGGTPALKQAANERLQAMTPTKSELSATSPTSSTTPTKRARRSA